MKIQFRALFSRAATIMVAAGCTRFPSSNQAGVRYRTIASQVPDQLIWKKIGVAHELINPTEKVVVISGGNAAISDEDWKSYNPPFPWTKNIERNLLFSQTAFLHSPDVPNGKTTIRTISGHSWIELARPIAVDFIPENESTNILKPAPGHLVVKVIQKAQVIRWDGPFIYQLSDGKGNLYVMHAFEDSSGPNLNVKLPAGWKLEKIKIHEPLIIGPFGGNDQGWYNIVGDCLGQGYHQYKYSCEFYPPN
jgi:hypothetical protein